MGLWDFLRYGMLAAIKAGMRQHWRLGQYLKIRGSAGDMPPTAQLDLRPGELVQVRSKKEILRTLNDYSRNRGLSVDVEMMPYCGRTFRVLARVEKIIYEKTGRTMRLPGACIILEGVTCGGCLSTNPLFCPRTIDIAILTRDMAKACRAGVRRRTLSSGARKRLRIDVSNPCCTDHRPVVDNR